MRAEETAAGWIPRPENRELRHPHGVRGLPPFAKYAKDGASGSGVVAGDPPVPNCEGPGAPPFVVWQDHWDRGRPPTRLKKLSVQVFFGKIAFYI